jgi:hypothetical protein
VLSGVQSLSLSVSSASIFESLSLLMAANVMSAVLLRSSKKSGIPSASLSKLFGFVPKPVSTLFWTPSPSLSVLVVQRGLLPLLQVYASDHVVESDVAVAPSKMSFPRSSAVVASVVVPQMKRSAVVDVMPPVRIVAHGIARSTK